MSTGQDFLTYVYAAVRPTEALRGLLNDVHGIGRAPVTLLTEASDAVAPAPSGTPAAPAPSDAAPDVLAFVVSPVPRGDFDEAALKEHFEDLRWLENVARAHHDVVQAVAAHATVLPLRMATVYQDDSRARGALVRQRHVFATRLAQLDAHTEYGVKIYLPAASDPAAPTAAAPSADGPPADQDGAEPLSPGKAYLRRRGIQHHARERVYQQAQEAARTVEAIAARYTSERVRHAPQSGALTGPRENVLNDAYLVPDRNADEFRAAVTQATQDFPDVLVEVTGPWAPYSFAMPAAEDPSPGDAGDVREPAP
ncbi:GvpL/GvpF family gas vesicle protein [Streptomyces sp. NPDC007355]|uniref:GvpL/GvpF family gas vesicle protein n=1 Tax=Streptomyces sp. NPDC007355 TaxID=3364778 RepID=UPI00369CAE8B